MVVALMWQQMSYIFTAIHLMGAKLYYFPRIPLFRGGGGGAILLTVKSDVMCQILWASTSCLLLTESLTVV